MEEMTDMDYIYILNARYGQITDEITSELIARLVLVNTLCKQQLNKNTTSNVHHQAFELNLRDLNRWLEGIALV